MNFEVLTTQLEECLEEDEAEIATCAIACYDYVRGRDGRVEGAWWWVEECEVGDQCVEEGCWERVLRGQAVAYAEAAAIRDFSEFLGGGTVGCWVHCVHELSTLLDIEGEQIGV